MPARRRFDFFGSKTKEVEGDAPTLEVSDPNGPVGSSANGFTVEIAGHGVVAAEGSNLAPAARGFVLDLEGEMAGHLATSGDDGPSTLLAGLNQAGAGPEDGLQPLAAFGVTVDGQLTADDLDHDGILVEQDLDQPDMC